MTEMVSGELHFIAGRGAGELRQGHHTGVVDQDVQRPAPGAHKAGHRGRIGQIQRCDLHPCRPGRQLFGDLVGNFSAGRQIAHRQRHLGAR
jgi:hypothetical protein